MTEDTAWRVTGFVLRVRVSFCLTSVRENNWKNVCWKTALFSLFSTRANHEGGGKVFILCPGYFLCCHVFPMVSELDYSLLGHVVINNDFEFCLRDMSRQGGSWLFCYLIGTSTVLITVQY